MKKISAVIIILSLMLLLNPCFFAFADSVRISQIDPSSLLLNQEIKLYVSVTDDGGGPVKGLSVDQFDIFESSDKNEFRKIPEIKSFESNANYEKGINFLLMIDNSGSMYRTMKGEKTGDTGRMRITLAIKAVKSFLAGVTNPMDRVGLVSYNSYYSSFSKPVRDKVEIERLLSGISRPKGDEAYTEIYSSLQMAVDEFRSVKGRKAIIILSDGENSPYYYNTKKPHRDFGEKIFKYSEPIDYCQKEGISVFAVNFGPKGQWGDRNLKRIATETGGALFNAHDRRELSNVYGKILNQVLNEYLIVYNATLEPADKKYVKLKYSRDGKSGEATRFYFSSTIFGKPLDSFSPWLLLPLLLALLLMWLLSRIKFEKKKTVPSLEVLSTRIGNVSTKMLPLGAGKTVIGGSANANMTIAGAPDVKAQHATIVFDEKKHAYTIAGDGDITVNNREAKDRPLESGDVIKIGGTVIVFDEGDMEREA